MTNTLRAALEDCVALIKNANPDAFKNGVTDQSGSIDEGEVWMSRTLDEALAALSANTGAGGDAIREACALACEEQRGSSAQKITCVAAGLSSLNTTALKRSLPPPPTPRRRFRRGNGPLKWAILFIQTMRMQVY